MKEFNASVFNENLKIAQDLLDQSQNTSYNPILLLEDFYQKLGQFPLLVESIDILPTTIDVYKNIILQLPYKDLQTSVDFIFNKYPNLITRDSYLIVSVIKDKPQSARYFFDKIYNTLIDQFNAEGAIGNSTHGLLSILCFGIMQNSQPENVDYFLNRIFELPPLILDVLSRLVSRLYANIPVSRHRIFDFIIKRTSSAEELIDLYSNLAEIIKVDISIAETCLTLVEKHLESSLLNYKTVSQMIKIVGYLTDFPEYKDRATELLKKITTKKSFMTINNLRDAARKLGNTEELRSTVRYGKRVKKTEENPLGWIDIKEIPVTEPCVFILGGDGSNTPKAANGYMKSVEALLNKNGLNDGVGIYSVVYNFGDTKNDSKFAFNEHAARQLLMQQRGHTLDNTPKSESIDDIDPRYIRQIFDAVFLPRISKDGKKISVSDALKNIRNITILAHCHGAYTFLKIEELMQQTMVDLGYNSTERASIQKQLLCVAYAPYCPLGVSKSTFISFASTRDYDVKHYNLFEKHIRNIIKPDGIGLSWFPDKRGNIFLVPQIYNGEYGEDHNFHGYSLDNSELSEDGRALIIFESNAITNGVKSSISNATLPEIKELVTSGDKDLEMKFEQAVRNGNKGYNQILENVRSSHMSK